MQSVLFWLVMAAIIWLVLWLCTDRSNPSDKWWPFDFRTSDPVTPQADAKETRGDWRGTRQNPARPWKRFGS